MSPIAAVPVTVDEARERLAAKRVRTTDGTWHWWRHTAAQAERWIVHHPADRPLEGLAVPPRTVWGDQLEEVHEEGGVRPGAVRPPQDGRQSLSDEPPPAH